MAKKPEKWSWTAAGLAFCHRCQEAYRNGKEDCETPMCEFYTRMPYRKKKVNKPQLSWMNHNPRQQGYVDYDGNPIKTGFINEQEEPVQVTATRVQVEETDGFDELGW